MRSANSSAWIASIPITSRSTTPSGQPISKRQDQSLAFCSGAKTRIGISTFGRRCNRNIRVASNIEISSKDQRGDGAAGATRCVAFHCLRATCRSLRRTEHRITSQHIQAVLRPAYSFGLSTTCSTDVRTCCLAGLILRIGPASDLVSRLVRIEFETEDTHELAKCQFAFDDQQLVV